MNPMDTLVARATDRLAELEHALHDLAQVRGRYTSPDGLVTALVDGNGPLVELHLAERITTLPARSIVSAGAAACVRIERVLSASQRASSASSSSARSLKYQ